MELGKAIIEILFHLKGADAEKKKVDAFFQNIQSKSDVASGSINKLDEKLKSLGKGNRSVKFDVKITEAEKRVTKVTKEEIEKRQAVFNKAIDNRIAKEKSVADTAIEASRRIAEAHKKKWDSIRSDLREEQNAVRALNQEKAAAAAESLRQAEIASNVANTRLGNRANSIIDPTRDARTAAIREHAQGLAILQQSQEKLNISQEEYEQGVRNLNREFNSSIAKIAKNQTKVTKEEISKRQEAFNKAIDDRVAKEKAAADKAIESSNAEAAADKKKWDDIASNLREDQNDRRKADADEKERQARKLAEDQKIAAQRKVDAQRELADNHKIIQARLRQLAIQRNVANTRLANRTNAIIDPSGAAQISALRERAHGMSVLMQHQERLGLSQKRYQKGLKSLNREYNASLLQFGLYGSALGKQSQLFRDIGFQISDVGRGLTRLGIALAASLAIPIKSFADFEQATIDVVAVLGDLNTEASRASGFEALSKKFLELGEQSEFTANQIAGAARQLGLAGFSAQEIQDSIESIANLASAGNVPLDRAAKISVNISKAFGIAANNLDRVSDVLAAVATNSNTTVESLGESFKLASPIAASLGQDLEVLAAAIGVLGNAGLSGTIAGTGINRFLSELLEKKDKVDALLKSVGSSFEKVDPTKLGIDEIIAEFTKLEELNLINTETFFSTFDQRSARAVVTLVNQGTESFANLTERARDAAGAAEAIRDTRIDTTLGSWKIAVSALTTSMIELGQTVEPLARDIISGLTSVAKSLTAIIREYPTLFEAASAGIAGMGAAAIIAGVSISGLGLAIRGLGLGSLAISMSSVIPKLTIFGRNVGISSKVIHGFGATATTAAKASRGLGNSIALTGSGLLRFLGPIALAATAVGSLALVFNSLYESSSQKSFESENEGLFKRIEDDAISASRTVSDLNKQIKAIDDLSGGNDLQANRFINSDTDFTRSSRDQIKALSGDLEELDKKLFEVFQIYRTDSGIENGILGGIDAVGRAINVVLDGGQNNNLSVYGVEAMEKDGERILRTYRTFTDRFQGTVNTEVDIAFADLSPKVQKQFDLIFRSKRLKKEIEVSIRENNARFDILRLVEQDEIDSAVDKIRQERSKLQLDILKNEDNLKQLFIDEGKDSKKFRSLSVKIEQQKSELDLVEKRFELGQKLAKQAQEERESNKQLDILRERKSKAVAKAGADERKKQRELVGPGVSLGEDAEIAIQTAKNKAGKEIDAEVDRINAEREAQREKRRKEDQRSQESIDRAKKEAEEIDKLREKQEERAEDRRIEDEGITKEDIEIEKIEKKIEQRKVQQNLISELNAIGEGTKELGKTFAGVDDDGNDILDDTRLTELEKKRDRDQKKLDELNEKEAKQGLSLLQAEDQQKLTDAVSATNAEIEKFLQTSKDEIKVLKQEIQDLQELSDKSRNKNKGKDADAAIKARKKEMKSLRDSQILIKKNSLEIAKKNKNLAQELKFTRELAELKNRETADSKISEELANKDPGARRAKDELEKSLEEKLQQDLRDIRKRYAEAQSKSINSVAKAQEKIQKSIADQLAKQVKNRQDALELQKIMVTLAGREQATRLQIARSLGKEQSKLIDRVEDGNFTQADREAISAFFNKVSIKLPGFDSSLLLEAISDVERQNDNQTSASNSLNNIFSELGTKLQESFQNFSNGFIAPVANPIVSQPPTNNTTNNENKGDVFINIENIDADGLTPSEVAEVVSDELINLLDGR